LVQRDKPSRRVGGRQTRQQRLGRIVPPEPQEASQIAVEEQGFVLDPDDDDWLNLLEGLGRVDAPRDDGALESNRPSLPLDNSRGSVARRRIHQFWQTNELFDDIDALKQRTGRRCGLQL